MHIINLVLVLTEFIDVHWRQATNDKKKWLSLNFKNNYKPKLALNQKSVMLCLSDRCQMILDFYGIRVHGLILVNYNSLIVESWKLKLSNRYSQIFDYIIGRIVFIQWNIAFEVSLVRIMYYTLSISYCNWN